MLKNLYGPRRLATDAGRFAIRAMDFARLH